MWKKLIIIIIIVVLVLLLLVWVVPVADAKDKPHHHEDCPCHNCREDIPVVEYPGPSGGDFQGSWNETKIAREQDIEFYIMEEE